MSIPTPTRRIQGASEEGYILISVMFMLAILMIAMTVAAPRIAKSIQRDHELETIIAASNIPAASRCTTRSFGAYPPNVDALVKTNEIRYLRKRYIDPTTGKDDWKPVQFGMQKTQRRVFGQPLALLELLAWA